MHTVYNDYFGDEHGNSHLRDAFMRLGASVALAQRGSTPSVNAQNVQEAARRVPPDLIVCGFSIKSQFGPELHDLSRKIPIVRLYGDAYEDIFQNHFLHYWREGQPPIYVPVKSWEHTVMGHKHSADVRFYWQPGWPHGTTFIHASHECKFQVLFIGNKYSEERRKIGDLLRSTFGSGLGLFGDWDYSGTQYAKWPAASEYCSTARVVFNHTDRRFRHLEWYLSNRVHSAMLAGRPVATVRTGSLETAYNTVRGSEEQNLILLDGDTEEETIESLKRVCDEYADHELNRIGLNGLKWAQEHATYDVFAKRILGESGWKHIGGEQ